MRVVICDDDALQREHLTQLVRQFWKLRGSPVDVAVFSSSEAFLFDYDGDQNVDVLLLDVEMGDMNGVDLAKELRRREATASIVFITGYPDYMAEGYDVSALHYLLKPVSREKLFAVLEKAVTAAAAQPRFLLLPDGKELVRVREQDVLYAEAQGHYLLLNTVDETLRLRMTVADFLQYGGAAFFKCSRSFAVGLRHVRRITKTTVCMENGVEIPLGKGLYDALNKALILFLRTM